MCTVVADTSMQQSNQIKVFEIKSDTPPPLKIKWTMSKFALKCHEVVFLGLYVKKCRWTLMFAPSRRNIQLCFLQLYKLHFTRTYVTFKFPRHLVPSKKTWKNTPLSITFYILRNAVECWCCWLQMKKYSAVYSRMKKKE